MSEQNPILNMIRARNLAMLPDDVPSMEMLESIPEQQPQQETGVLEAIGQELVNAYEGTIAPMIESPGAQIIESSLKGAANVPSRIINNVGSLVSDFTETYGLPNPGIVWESGDLGSIRFTGNVPREAQAAPYIFPPDEDMPGVQEFVTEVGAFMSAFKSMGGMKAKLLSPESYAAGAIADMMFDPVGGNLSNMAREYGFDNELTRYLETNTKEDDPAYKQLEARVKNTFEGGIVGVLADSILFAIKQAKPAWQYLKSKTNPPPNMEIGPVQPLQIDADEALDAARAAEPEAMPSPRQEVVEPPKPMEDLTQTQKARVNKSGKPEFYDGQLISVGPGSIKVNIIAKDKPLYRETNLDGLTDLIYDQRYYGPKKMYVTDDPYLAIGQKNNRGVLIEFRPNTLSGRAHTKPGLEFVEGNEYITDAMAKDSIQSITFKKSILNRDGKLKIAKFTHGILKKEYEMEELADGSLKFTRKAGAK